MSYCAKVPLNSNFHLLTSIYLLLVSKLLVISLIKNFLMLLFETQLVLLSFLLSCILLLLILSLVCSNQLILTIILTKFSICSLVWYFTLLPARLICHLQCLYKRIHVSLFLLHLAELAHVVFFLLCKLVIPLLLLEVILHGKLLQVFPCCSSNSLITCKLRLNTELFHVPLSILCIDQSLENFSLFYRQVCIPFFLLVI